MLDYLLVLIFQILFNIFKVLEIKFTFNHQLRKLLINSVLINLTSLASVYYSLDRLFKDDWPVILFYISGSLIGKWLAMTKFHEFDLKIAYRKFKIYISRLK